MIDRLPRWELARQQAPVTARAHEVKDAVQDDTPRPLQRTTSRFGRGDQRFQNLPLGISQVGSIEAGRRGHARLLVGGTSRLSPRLLFRQFLAQAPHLAIVDATQAPASLDFLYDAR